MGDIFSFEEGPTVVDFCALIMVTPLCELRLITGLTVDVGWAVLLFIKAIDAAEPEQLLKLERLVVLLGERTAQAVPDEPALVDGSDTEAFSVALIGSFRFSIELGGRTAVLLTVAPFSR